MNASSNSFHTLTFHQQYQIKKYEQNVDSFMTGDDNLVFRRRSIVKPIYTKRKEASNRKSTRPKPRHVEMSN